MNSFGARLMLMLTVSPVRTFMNISISNINEERNTFVASLMTYDINKGVSRISKKADCPFTSSSFQASF